MFPLPKAVQFNCSSAFTERSKIEQGLSEEKEATNHTEAEKFSFFLTANALKIKSIKATNSVDIGARPRTVTSAEHVEACQKHANLSSPVHGD